MRLFICGVRGSTPAPGADFVRYGGATSCIAVAGDADDVPRLVIDAGTGLQRLGRILDGRPFRGTMLLGHLHWDHTHGLPFFPSADHPDADTTVLLPAPAATAQAGDDGGAVEMLARCMSPPHFPVRPDELRGSWRFGFLGPGTREIEGLTVLALEIPHKGGTTFGYRISDARSSVAYLSDHGPVGLGPGPDGFGEYHDVALQLAGGVDLLVHDAQHTAAEFAARAHFGHSTIDYAVGLAERSGAARLLLYHHDPNRTDAELDTLVALHRKRFPALDAAAEGTVIDLPGQAADRTAR